MYRNLPERIGHCLITGSLLLASLPTHAAEPAQFSGYIDAMYVANSSITTGPENTFNTEAEADASGYLHDISGRIDLDMDKNGQISVEQVFGSWVANEQFTLNGGRMNSPLGLEKEDRPNLLDSITHGLIYRELDAQSPTLPGNNLDGVTGDFDMEIGTLTLGIIDEPHSVPEKNAYLVSAVLAPNEMVEIELNYLSQEDPTTTELTSAGDNKSLAGLSYGDMGDINVTVTLANLTLAAEVASGTEVVNLMWGIHGILDMTDRLSGAIRYESVNFDSLPTSTTGVSYSRKDLTQWTVSGTVALTDRLDMVGEISILDNGSVESKSGLLDFVLTLGDYN
ncbi:MAG: hypothetical protein D6698_06470 [Gammaproteobacteria bacterium]|nr:MAG: hypothetical protein D6698_06470 [Gammaproteobacteria bacterium]